MKVVGDFVLRASGAVNTAGLVYVFILFALAILDGPTPF